MGTDADVKSQYSIPFINTFGKTGNNNEVIDNKCRNTKPENEQSDIFSYKCIQTLATTVLG